MSNEGVSKKSKWRIFILFLSFMVGLSAFLNDSTGFIDRIFKNDSAEADEIAKKIRLDYENKLRRNFEDLYFFSSDYFNDENFNISKEELKFGKKILMELFESNEYLGDDSLSIRWHPKSKEELNSFFDIEDNLVCELYSVVGGVTWKIFYISTKKEDSYARTDYPVISIIYVNVIDDTYEIDKVHKLAFSGGYYNGEPEIHNVSLGELAYVTVASTYLDRWEEGTFHYFYDSDMNLILRIRDEYNNTGWTEVTHLDAYCWKNSFYTIDGIEKSGVPTIFVDRKILDTIECSNVVDEEIYIFEYSRSEKAYLNSTFNWNYN